MEENTAETSTVDATNTTEVAPAAISETNTTNEDTSQSITEVSAVEAAKTADVPSVEETTQTETEAEPVYQIGDKEITLSRLDDLEKGEFRQSDYTKKSQEAAVIRQGLEAKTAEVDGLKTYLSDAIANIEKSIESEYSKEDMLYLRDNDPSEYLKKTEEKQEKVATAEKAKQDLKTLADAANEEKIAVEQKLFNDSMTSWVDPKQKESDIKLMEAYTTKAGFTSEDFDDIKGHRSMLALYKAAKYDELQASTAETAKQVSQAPKTIKASVKTKPKAAPTSVAQRFYGT